MTKILIVDDEPAIGKLLMYQLSSSYAVTYISDGLSALERIERERPDLVLLDVMMPTISGWEVCHQIRASSSVPVIMLTAKSSDADIVTGLAAGADDYIAKPFNMPQLQARIEAVLRRARNGSRTRATASAPQSQSEPLPLSADTLRAQQVTRVVPATSAVPAPLPVARTEQKPDAVAMPAVHEPTQQLGTVLREARLSRSISLILAARECNTRWEFLQAIEQENYAYVPRPQLRTALQRYGDYLGVDIKPWTAKGAPANRHSHVLQYATMITLLLLVIAVGVYFL